MNISLHQLRVFTAVAQQRSFTRVGDLFGLTQSAISRAVRELEHEIDLKLFDRTTRQVRLTEAGENLAGRIGHLIEEIDEVLHNSHGTREQLRGVVRVAGAPLLSSSLIPECMANCHALFPELSVVLYDKAQQAVLQCVTHGSADFGVIADPADGSFDASTEFDCETLLVEPLCVVLPAGHPLAAHAVVPWQALRGAVLSLPDTDCGAQPVVQRALAAHGLQYRADQGFSHPAAILKMVSLGLGLGVLPAAAVSTVDTPQLAVRPLSPTASCRTLLVRRKGRSLRPGAATLWNQLTACVGRRVLDDAAA
ncbi:LysR family transcriptional regulator [Pandoraea sp.]|uniref:LysR family transcriptional regulator n=1 Tax=Pandoraea sp. TaxID=1883445 RepID=UPI001224821E|nr:LysR family transcriptional regulator [Pandoraea sp.]TAL53059.1 MAG: LysR family transcriptional regulator [Pandoraea sp.]TAM14785.1 MAG: LysR family transcriptional regulator [Pandoraea sp.]